MIKNIIFGTIDGLFNEFDEFVVQGYPTIMLFKPGKDKFKNYVIFDAVFSYNNLKSFLELNMKTKINDYMVHTDL